MHLVHGQHADLSQFFVREVRLFLSLRLLCVESRFARDAGSIPFHSPNSTDRAAPGYVFELLRFHDGIPHAGSKPGVFFTAKIMAL